MDFLYVLILKVLKVLCFDTVLQVLILKSLEGGLVEKMAREGRAGRREAARLKVRIT